MARTVQQIYDEIVSYKDTQSAISALAPNGDNFQGLLAQLGNGSQVAIWRLWAFLLALAIATHENLFDLFKVEVQTIANNAAVGTVGWYVKQVYDFQYSDILVYVGTKYQYATQNNTLKIVKRCAIEERGDGVLRFKVAKLNNGNLEGLNQSTEIPALVSYLKKIRFAGTRFVVFTNNGDLLHLFYTIYYDPIIAQANVQAFVEQAIQDYIQNLPFNGELLLSKLTDKIQLVTGVKDVVFASAAASFSGATFNSFDRFYIADGGYFKIDPNLPLSNSIQYIAS